MNNPINSHLRYGWGSSTRVFFLSPSQGKTTTFPAGRPPPPLQLPPPLAKRRQAAPLPPSFSFAYKHCLLPPLPLPLTLLLRR